MDITKYLLSETTIDLIDIKNFINKINNDNFVVTDNKIEILKKIKFKKSSISDHLSIIKYLEKSAEQPYNLHFNDKIQTKRFHKNAKMRIFFILYLIYMILLNSYNLNFYNPHKIIFGYVHSFDTDLSKTALKLLNLRYSNLSSRYDREYLIENFNFDIFFNSVKFSYFEYLNEKNFDSFREIPEEYNVMENRLNTTLNQGTYFDRYIPYICKLDKEKAMKLVFICKINVFLRKKEDVILSILYGILLALKTVPYKFKPSNSVDYYSLNVYSLTKMIRQYSNNDDTSISSVSIQILESLFESQFFVLKDKICLRIYDKNFLEFLYALPAKLFTEKINFLFNFMKESVDGKMNLNNFISKMESLFERKQTKENLLNLIFSIFKLHEFQGDEILAKKIISLFYNDFHFNLHSLQTPILDVPNQLFNSLFNTIYIIFKNISFDEAYRLEIINYLKIFYKNNICFVNDSVKFSFIELFTFLDEQKPNNTQIYLEFATFFNKYFVIEKRNSMKHYDIFIGCVFSLRNVDEIYFKYMNIMLDELIHTDFLFLLLLDPEYSSIFNNEILWIYKNFTEKIKCYSFVEKFIEIALINERKYFISNRKFLCYHEDRQESSDSSEILLFKNFETLDFYTSYTLHSTFYRFLSSICMNFFVKNKLKIESHYIKIFNMMSLYSFFDEKINVDFLQIIDSFFPDKNDKYLIFKNIILEIEHKMFLFERNHKEKALVCTFEADSIEIFCKILKSIDFFDHLQKNITLFTEERCKRYLKYFKNCLKFTSKFCNEDIDLWIPNRQSITPKILTEYFERKTNKSSFFEKSHAFSYHLTFHVILYFKRFLLSFYENSQEFLIFNEISLMVLDSDFYLCDIMLLTLEYIKSAKIDFIRNQILVFFNNLFSVMKKNILNSPDENNLNLKEATKYVLKIYRNYINTDNFSLENKNEISYKLVLYFAKYFDEISVDAMLILTKFLKKFKIYSSLAGFKEILPNSLMLKSFFQKTLNKKIDGLIGFSITYKNTKDLEKLGFNFYFDLFHAHCFYFISETQYRTRILFLMIYQIIFFTDFDSDLLNRDGFLHLITTNLLIIYSQKFLMKVEKERIHNFIAFVNTKSISNINDKKNVSCDDYIDFFISIMCISKRYNLFTEEEIFKFINFKKLISLIGDENTSNDFLKKVLILINFFIYDNEFNKKYLLFLLQSSSDDSYKKLLFKRCFMNINLKENKNKSTIFYEYFDETSTEVNIEEKKKIVEYLLKTAYKSKNANILLYLTKMFHLMPNLVKFVSKKYIFKIFFSFILQEKEIKILTNLNQIEWHLNYFGELFLVGLIYNQDTCLQYQTIGILLELLQHFIDSILENRENISLKSIKKEVLSKISFDSPCKKPREKQKIEPLNIKEEYQEPVPVEIKNEKEKEYNEMIKNNILILLKLIYKILKSKPCCCRMCLDIFKNDENNLKKELASLFIENGILRILKNIFFIKNTDFDFTEKYSKYSSFIVNEMIMGLYEVKTFPSSTVFHSYLPHLFGDLFEYFSYLPAYLKKTDISYSFYNLINDKKIEPGKFKMYLDYAFDFNLELDRSSDETKKSSDNSGFLFNRYKTQIKLNKSNFTEEKKIDYKNLLSVFFKKFLNQNKLFLTKDMIDESKNKNALMKNNISLYNNNPGYIIEILYVFYKIFRENKISFLAFYFIEAKKVVEIKENIYNNIKKRNIEYLKINYLEGIDYQSGDIRDMRSQNSSFVNPQLDCSSTDLQLNSSSVESPECISDQINSSDSFKSAESSLSSNEEVDSVFDFNIFHKFYFNKCEYPEIKSKLILYFKNSKNGFSQCKCKIETLSSRNMEALDIILNYSFLFACGYSLNSAIGKVSFFNFIFFIFTKNYICKINKNRNYFNEIIESVRKRYFVFKLPEIDRKISVLTDVFIIFDFLYSDLDSLHILKFYLYDNFHFRNYFLEFSYLSEYSDVFSLKKEILKMKKKEKNIFKSTISTKQDRNPFKNLSKKKKFLFLNEEKFEILIYFRYKYSKNILFYLDCLCKIICYKMDVLFNEMSINNFDIIKVHNNDIFRQEVKEIHKIIYMEYKNIKSYTFNQELIEKILSNNFWPVLSTIMVRNCTKAGNMIVYVFKTFLKFTFFCYDIRRHLNCPTMEISKFEKSYRNNVDKNCEIAFSTLVNLENDEVSLFYLRRYDNERRIFSKHFF